MADKQALGAQTSIGIKADKGGISLEKDSSGQDQERACVPLFNAVPPGVMRFAGVQSGWAVIKLWDINRLGASLYVSGAYVENGGPQTEFLGTRVDTITETVSFNNSQEASLSKGAAAYGVSVLARTPFFGGSTPSYSNGVFRANAAVTGTLVVEYKANYSAHKIFYGLPEHIIQKIFREGQQAVDITIPPVLVMAYAEGQAAVTQIERKISAVTPPDCKDDDWLTDTFESTHVKYRTYAESDMDNTQTPPVPKLDANYLEVKAYIKHVQYCRNRTSRRKIQTYPLPAGNNIEIIEQGQGSI